MKMDTRLAFEVCDDADRVGWDDIRNLQQEVIQARLIAFFETMGLDVIWLDDGEAAA